MSNIVVITGNADPTLVLAASSSGPGSTTFFHNSGAEMGRPGELFPAVFIFAITDIVGSFSALQVNLEWSPITPTGSPQFQTIGTWTPLVGPTAFFPCSSTGQYRLNCTTFTGGTSFNVYASIAAAMPQGSAGSGGSVTQGTVPWIDLIEARAALTNPTPVADGQTVQVMADKIGRVATVLNAVRALIGTASVQSTTNSPVTLIAAGATGVFNDICEMVLTNESSTATVVSISDGTTTYKYALSGNGGLTKTFVTPLVQGSSATAWTILNSAGVSVDCTIVYAKNI